VSAASSPDGNAIVTGHLDGTINRFFFDDGISGASQGKFAHHHIAPVVLNWAETVMAVGPDRLITFYDHDGKVSQSFDYSQNPDIQEFTCSEQSPSAQTIVLGGFNRLHVFNYVNSKQQWEEVQPKIIENFYSVSALAWKPDGSRLVAGNMNNAVELFDCCLRRSRYKGKFEFNYVSPSQVIVKRLSTGSRIVLKSHYGYEIQKVNIFQDQYLIANTPETLLMGDLTSCKLSEVPWTGSGNEKFFFEQPQVCMVFNAGELSLVEYGVNEVLGSCRTEHMSPHLISVRINERKSEEDIKRVAYLVDAQTIQILDLTNSTFLGTIAHDAKVDWLELSGKANKLLFRDKKRQLNLFDIDTQTRYTLLHFCSYVQWVPNSDVVVAQSRGNLCIWYSIDSPERVTMFPIKGEIEDIERANGKTEVVVDEGVNTVSYTLDEGLIEFGSALDEKDYDRAIALLESLEMTSETEAMWKSISNVALKDQKLAIAERCYAALGDVAKTRYLRNLNELAEELHLDQNSLEDHYMIRAKLAVLDRQFDVAESIFLERGKVDEAMEMYQEMHKWDLSIRVAEHKNHPELDNLKRNYFQWLVDSGQEERAGQLKEEEGDYVSAINLYLKGGLPARAASLLLQQNLNSNLELTERIADSLYKNSMYERAGELFESLGRNEKALEAYKRGKSYRLAVELSRAVFPGEVTKLEEQWGDYLVSLKQVDGAINHYIEAGLTTKALEAAIQAKQWKKAVSIVDTLEVNDKTKKYFLQIADYFSTSNELALAEKFYVAAGHTQSAVNMYVKQSKWEKAHMLAITYMTKENVNSWFMSQAQEMEKKSKFKDAEKLYLTIGEPDIAITMYKNHRHYEDMVRLVSIYHKDLLSDTHQYLGKTLEAEGNFKQSEHHYCESGDFKAAINMYCSNNMFEDAYRVGKSHGGPNAAKQVAYLWARSLGGEAAVKLLTKFNLLDSAIDFATENGAFEFAFELSRFADKHKLADVHYKHAMYLEDEGKFKEAESAFILAGKPREAILMYIHEEDWDRALAIAEQYEPVSVPEVLMGQAKISFQGQDFAKAEALVLRAQRPEFGIKLYKEANLWKEAIKFARQYVPNRVAEVQQEYDRYLAGQSDAGKDQLLTTAAGYERQKDFSRAIDLYMKLSTSHSDNMDFLEDKWRRAVELAVKFVPDRTQEVAEEVCRKLLEIKRYGPAGDLYLGMESFKVAIDTYIAGGLWDKAKKVLQYAPKFTDYVENQYVKHLKSSGKTDQLAGMDANAALDLYAERGDWEKCLEAASTMTPEVQAKYTASYCTLLITQNKYHEAVRVLAKFGAPPSQSNLELYQRLAMLVLRDPKSTETDYLNLRQVMYRLVYGSSIAPQPKMEEKFGQLLWISHLSTLKAYCNSKKELQTLASKQAIALLRYTKQIPADYAFLEAGQSAKNAGNYSMAFVCWNRLLDLTEAIEEGDLSMLENADFEGTDVPFDIPLPEKPMSSERLEQIRDWVLQTSLDQKVNQELDKRECAHCHTKTYAASLVCHHCSHKSEPCVVTGYPVIGAKVKCSTCSRSANQEDWNKYVMTERVIYR
jgi:intraflagellar transport protein 172